MAIAQPIGRVGIGHGAPHRRARDVYDGNPGRVEQKAPLARRLLAASATVATLVGLWFGTGVLATAQHAATPVTRAPHVAAGLVYVVKPGDTLWSIATSLLPRQDPTTVVAALRSELHGGTLRPGAVLRLP